MSRATNTLKASSADLALGRHRSAPGAVHELPFRRQFLAATSAGVSAAWLARPTFAGPFAPGVETIAPPSISGDERTRQPDIWALEVHFKPVRMEYVDLPVPGQGGKTQRTLVWYLCYRAINRPIAGEAPTDMPADQRPLFIPELTLVTEDGESQKSIWTALFRRLKQRF